VLCPDRALLQSPSCSSRRLRPAQVRQTHTVRSTAPQRRSAPAAASLRPSKRTEAHLALPAPSTAEPWAGTAADMALQAAATVRLAVSRGRPCRLSGISSQTAGRSIADWAAQRARSGARRHSRPAAAHLAWPTLATPATSMPRCRCGLSMSAGMPGITAVGCRIIISSKTVPNSWCGRFVGAAQLAAVCGRSSRGSTAQRVRTQSDRGPPGAAAAGGCYCSSRQVHAAASEMKPCCSQEYTRLSLLRVACCTSLHARSSTMALSCMQHAKQWAQPAARGAEGSPGAPHVRLPGQLAAGVLPLV
jgi:hypothetical protein